MADSTTIIRVIQRDQIFMKYHPLDSLYYPDDVGGVRYRKLGFNKHIILLETREALLNFNILSIWFVMEYEESLKCSLVQGLFFLRWHFFGFLLVILKEHDSCY